jgi:hypothetical protein
MSTYATDSKGKDSEKDDEKLLEEIRKCFKRASAASSEQRKREKEDLEFQIPEKQWSTDAISARKGGIVGNVAVPARPMISVSLLQQPIQLVKNQAAAADLGVNVHPVSEKAQDEIAEVKQGLYRRIERDSDAEQVRLWALDRATQCGIGWYRVVTRYDEDGDDPFDQEIGIERFLYGDCVKMDPAAQKQDFSDANFAFVTDWLPWDDFKRLYPDSKASLDEAGSGLDWDGYAEEEPDWVRDDDGGKAVQVAEYFRKHKVTETLCLFADGTQGTEKEANGREIIKKRSTEKVTLKWYKCTGAEILERGTFDGVLIPLIPVIGRELQPFDSQRRWEGMVRPARDGQRTFNYAISSAVEDVGRLSKVPYIAAEGQMEGYEDQWNQANVRNFPYLYYKTKTLSGQDLPAPQPMQIDGSKLGLSLQLAETAKGLVQSATAVYDPSLGETPKRGQSGRAVIAQQQQSDAGTSNYLQSLAKISMPYEARVVLGLMPFVYDRPGRVTQILGGEDEKESTVMLGAPFVPGPDGRPMDPAMMAPPMDGQPMPQPKTIDLTQGKYSVSVSIGKSYQTRLQQGQEEFGALLESMPPEIQVLLLPTYMRFRDSPGAKEAAELLTKFRDGKFPGLAGDENAPPTPEQMQAELQSMKQQGQEMQEQLKGAIEEIKTQQAKQQAQIEAARIKAETDIQLAQINNAAKINVAQINAEAKGFAQASEAQTQELATGQEQAFEGQENQEDRAHEVALEVLKQSAQRRLAQQGMANENAQAERGMAHEDMKSERGMQHDDEQSRAGQEHERMMRDTEPPKEPE